MKHRLGPVDVPKRSDCGPGFDSRQVHPMSRSFKKQPFATYCGNSQKKAKSCYNRIWRRTTRVSLRVDGEDAEFKTHETAMDRWNMPQDGTRRYRPYQKYAGRLSYRDWYRWAKAK